MQSWCIVNRGLGSVVEVLLRNLVPLSLVIVLCLLAWDIPWLRLAFLALLLIARDLLGLLTLLALWRVAGGSRWCGRCWNTHK